MSLRRRLRRVEAARREQPQRHDPSWDWIESLSDEELDSLWEPLETASKMVPCPTHGEPCAAQCDNRMELGLATFPELNQKYERRLEELRKEKEQ